MTVSELASAPSWRAAHEMEQDLRVAGRVCSRFATLRFRVAEIAEEALTQAGARIRRDLLDALADAEF
jgi:hypothetical protein